MPIRKVKRMKEKRIFKGRIFDLHEVDLKASEGHRFTHHVIKHPGASVIIPLVKHDQFLMVRQYRSAIHQVMWEFPAGTLEKGETPLQCAKREVIEEVGHQAKHFEKLAVFYPVAGISTEKMFLYVATGLTERYLAQDKDEFLEASQVSFTRLQRMISNGKIKDGKTLIAFYYYSQWRKRVKKS